MALLRGELTDHAGLGEEHTPSEERNPQAALLGRDPAEQTLELLGLLVGQRERVVEGAASLPGEGPGRAVVRQLAAIVLDLDEVEACRGRDQEVDLADMPLVGDEGEVGLGLKGVAVRQELADVLLRCPFVGEGRRGDLVPPAGVRLHSVPLAAPLRRGHTLSTDQPHGSTPLGGAHPTCHRSPLHHR